MRLLGRFPYVWAFALHRFGGVLRGGTPSCRLHAAAVGLQSEDGEEERFLSAMRMVPSPVTVVTTGNATVKRGVTCSSFTSASRLPPVVSFAVQRSSRMHELMTEIQQFAVHVLSEKQVRYSIHFSQPAADDRDQFDSIPHSVWLEHIPLLEDCCVVMRCQAHSVQSVGDHHVWYGNVVHTSVQNSETPLLYYARAYHGVGEQAFMAAFESATLDYEQWTHEAHLRMAWNYISAHGKDKAIPLIRTGIKNYIEKNDKLQMEYNETVTLFFIHMVNHALQKFGSEPHTFEEFLSGSLHLTRPGDLLHRHYSTRAIQSPEARMRWLEPDILALP